MLADDRFIDLFVLKKHNNILVLREAMISARARDRATTTMTTTMTTTRMQSINETVRRHTVFIDVVFIYFRRRTLYVSAWICERRRTRRG
jgi:hypothetical protein